MRNLLLFAVFLALLSCHKSNGYSTNAIMGNWRYTGSILDSMNGHPPYTGYDNAVGGNLGDTLRFTAPDTVHYIYRGADVWSNFRVQGSQLFLIGSAAADTLTIHTLTGSQLQIGTQTSGIAYWMVFEKF